MTPLSKPIRRGLVAGCAVLVLGGAAVGIAAAQSQPTTTPSGQQAQSGYQKFVDALAKRLNVPMDKLQTAITEARADAGLPANGAAFPGARGGQGGRGRGGSRIDLNAAATAIGIPADQLRTELNGKSLAQVATAHGKTAADVSTALKNAAHQRIDQAVTAGKVAADQANTQKTQTDQRIDQLVNQTLPQGGPGGFREHAGSGEDLNTAATAIGIPVDQLRSELNGKSLAQVAAAHNKTANEVATALKNAAHQRVDQAVSAGKLTAEQASQQKTSIDQRIDTQINQVAPQRAN